MLINTNPPMNPNYHKWKPVEEVKSEFPKEYQEAIKDYLALYF